MSRDAIDLLQKMFNRNPKERPTAAECLNHVWFQNQIRNDDLQTKGNASNIDILENLRQFNGAKKLQQAAMNFIQTNLVDSREKERLRKIFVAMDTNFDGKLT